MLLRKLLLRAGKLRIGLRFLLLKLYFPRSQLLQPCVNLRLRRLQLGLPLIPLLLLALQLSLAFIQLRFGGLKLLQRLLALRLILLKALVICRLSVLQLLPRLRLYGLIPALRQLFRQRFQGVRHVGQKLIILGIVKGIIFIQFQSDLCIYPIQIKRTVCDIQIRRQGALSQRGAAPFKIHKNRGAAQADNGKFFHRQAVPRILFIGLGQGQGLSNVRVCIVEAVRQALSCPLRPPARLQLRHADLRRQTEQAKGQIVLGVLTAQKHIQGDGALRRSNPRLLRQRLHSLPGVSICVENPQIKQGLRVYVILRRRHHVAFGGTQSHQKTGAQRNDRQNGQIPTQRLLNGAAEVSPHGPAHHSISETGWGVGLIRDSTTVPFFTRTTRSAMAVSAELWVMIKTVMPVLRPVSCSSFKMAFPVL